jgi:hypothetical protein
MNSMSKKIILGLILFSAISFASAERIAWIKNYTEGGTGVDVISTKDGNLMFLGGSHNIRLVKTDKGGQVLWNTTFPQIDSCRTDYSNWIKETSDGGFLVIAQGDECIEELPQFKFIKTNDEGTVISNVSFIGYPLISVTTNDNGSLYVTLYEVTNEIGEYEYYWRFIKTDAYGSILWNKSLAKKEYDNMKSIIENPDGSYLTIGRTTYHGYRVFVTKLDSNGNLLWNKTLNNTIDPEEGGDDYGFQIHNALDGGYIVLAIQKDMKTWLIKIDLSGNMLWNKTFSGPRGEEDGEIISKYLRPTNDGYITIGVSDMYYIWMIKTDLLGNMIWNRTIRVDHNGIINVLGTSDGGELMWTLYSDRSDDWILIKTDYEGNILWNITTPILDSTNSLIEDLDGNYVGAGTMVSFKIENTTTSTTTTSTTTTIETTTTSIPTTIPTTIATTTSSTTSSTATTLGNCPMPGDLPPCGEIILSEVVAYINQWVTGEASLSDVVALINAWATG